MDRLQLRPLVIVRRHAEGLFSACLAFAPKMLAYADDRETALAELSDFLSAYFAELPADDLQKFLVPEEALAREVTVVLPRAGLSRGERIRTPVSLPVIVLSLPSGASWVMLPTLGQVVYVGAERAHEFEQALREEVENLAAARELDGADYLDLLPPQSFELERPLVEVESDKDAGRQGQKARAYKAAEKLLESVGRKLGAPNDVVIGRELEGLCALLDGEARTGLVLVGPEGVGKSAWLRAAVALTRRVFYATSGAELVAGQSALGQLEQRVEAVIEAAALTDSVLYFENLEDLFAGEGGGHADIASLLRRHLQLGRLRLVGELTPEAYDRLSQRHVGFFSYLQRFGASALSVEQTSALLARRSQACLRRGQRGMNEAARRELLALVERYEPYRVLPGKAVRLFDELTGESPSPSSGDSAPELGADDVLSGFAAKTGIPAFLLRDERALQLSSIERFFAEHVVGQERAVRRVAETLCSVKAGLQPSGKPLATLLFLGPTGVGKTELSKALARFLFGSADRMARFDMSEYTDAFAADRLIRGSDRADGVLTRRVREQPFGVVLLDEIEKAHSSVFDLLLQVAGEGRLSDGRGRVAYFHNTILILTSNLGAQYRRPSLGFGSAADADDARYYLEQVERHFRPELVGRLDSIVTFSSLDAAQIRRVAALSIERIGRRAGLEGRESRLLVSDAALQVLAEDGFSAEYGARGLRRFLEQELVAPLAGLVSALGEQASQALFLVQANHESGVSAALQPALRDYHPAALPPVVQGRITISAALTARRTRARASAGIASVSSMRRSMRRWHALSALEEARERRAEVSVQLTQAAQSRTPSSTSSSLRREHQKLDALLVPLEQALRDVEALESLLIAALDEALPDFEDEARTAFEAYRERLLNALFELSEEDSACLALQELDDQRALHEFLVPLLRFANARGWELYLHFDRGARTPVDAWPALEARRWGPPILGARYLAELPAERPSDGVLVRVRGPGAGALLSLYLGRVRFPRRDGFAELWVRALGARFELEEEHWQKSRFSPVIDRAVGRRQPFVFQSASTQTPADSANHAGVAPDRFLERWAELMFDRALAKASAGSGFLPKDQ